MKKLEDIEVSNPYLKLPDSFYDFTNPTPLKEPHLIHANIDLAKELNIDANELKKEEFTNLINGSWQFKGSKPFAMVYAGHQFGHFVPRLGDGRAINIGTINKQHLQLKGAGETKYSRSGDGRAVLRSSIREYLVSELMHNLGVPTTRALGIIGSKHRVFRESWESGSIVLRVSPSWVRVGTFEYFAYNHMYKELKELLEYVIKESYPDLIDSKNRYELFLIQLIEKSAKLVAKWMSIGFNHGVLNTDNFSIAGLSIDYGPFAFFDDYDFNYICNHTDANGRYSFGNQPYIFKWNLAALINALQPLLKELNLEMILNSFDELYINEFHKIMMKKLGLFTKEPKDKELLKHLLGVMQTLQPDYTLFFRELSNYSGDRERLLKLCLYHQPMNEWLDSYDARLQNETIDTEDRLQKMKSINPKYILKNYMIQLAIDRAENGDFRIVDNLFKIAQNPYKEMTEFEEFSKETPKIYKNRKLSCSS